MRLGRAVAIGLVLGAGATAAGQIQEWAGVLDEHPRIQYATRRPTDRVAKLIDAIAHGRPLARDAQTGYLRPLLEALDVPVESQLLVFSKTGVQRAYTNPHTPRALYYNESVAVGYVPDAPVVEIASHDPHQGVIFYTLDQHTEPPVLRRAMVCLSCHVSATTMNVPGLIARSNTVGDDGMVMPQFGSNDVDHRTPHPDRWGGWYVTSDATAQSYSQRAHAGNITTTPRGFTSNQVFVDWMNSAPETRGYLSPLSDIVALLVFDHQTHAINLMTRINWESRIDAPAGELQALVDQLADYLLFVGEMPPSVPLAPRPGFAEHLAARIPRDRKGRSLADLDLDRRLMRYPCSYMIYSEAFDALPTAVKQRVYRRMLETLSTTRVRDDDRRAILEILRDTKPEFTEGRTN
jgi:hypothetical protein